MRRIAPTIPNETYSAAREIYNIRHVYLRIGDGLNSILNGIDIKLLDPTASLKHETLFRLALISAFQFAETLPDPLAVEALQKRMDWKYALFLPVDYPGISDAALCQFRTNLLTSQKGLSQFSLLLGRLAEVGLLARRDPPVGPEEVFRFLCALTRLYWLQYTLKAALAMLGSTVPEWLRSVAQPHWYEQYKKVDPPANWFLKNGVSLEEEAQRTGADAFLLLEFARDQLPAEIWKRSELINLKRICDGQFSHQAGQFSWQPPVCRNCLCRYSLSAIIP